MSILKKGIDTERILECLSPRYKGCKNGTRKKIDPRRKGGRIMRQSKAAKLVSRVFDHYLASLPKGHIMRKYRAERLWLAKLPTIYAPRYVRGIVRPM